MRLQRLTGLEQEKIENEYNELKIKILTLKIYLLMLLEYYKLLKMNIMKLMIVLVMKEELKLVKKSAKLI